MNFIVIESLIYVKIAIVNYTGIVILSFTQHLSCCGDRPACVKHAITAAHVYKNYYLLEVEIRKIYINVCIESQNK